MIQEELEELSGSSEGTAGGLRGGLAFLVLLLAGLLLVPTACADDGDDGEQATGNSKLTPVQAAFGETADLGAVQVRVGALSSKLVPVLPYSVVEEGVPLARGEAFYQASLLVENEGAVPVRVDPLDFLLIAGDLTLYPDPRRSGPSPRSLLPGASLDVIVTFPGPRQLDASLRYTPEWYPAGLTVANRAAEAPAEGMEAGAG